MEFVVDDLSDKRIHRTWVQLLLDSGYNEIAAIAVDSEISARLRADDGDTMDGSLRLMCTVEILIPTASYNYVMSDEEIQTAMLWAVKAITNEQRLLKLKPEIAPPNWKIEDCWVSDVDYPFGVKSVEPEPDWQEQVRRLILGSGVNNQGRITEIIRARNQEQVLLYNEMKFASQSEIRIAQALEKKGVLFFPLPLAVRHTTGKKWQDHREADFIICDDGKWGILEVAHHDPNRYEQDAEKSDWFKTAGILCVQHYTAENCYNKPDETVGKFLEILAKY